MSQADVAAAHGTADLDALLTTLDDGTHPADEIQAKPIITSDGKAQIDWQYIDTSEPRADTANYDYPIALDSEAVANYAKAYNISPKAAQHSIVVGMAAPEALGKILDQLADGKYIGHTLTDGEKMSLVITTTADVVGETHEYVFADNFGKGLVLPIVIAPKDTP
ncbi:hypothetical protein B0181_01755 [Moraxella caviae]|uniref:Uncharacterized protein n=1 Tax=Moraxella caviae TaxID=34060 RepID=A0A1T0AAQ3_9GAMM|nr:hypothetical protein B0181_01755 [Moraxella caviae]